MISKENKVPALNGLVLAGGKSKRMGTPKDLMKWHGKEQRFFAADLLKSTCQKVFISCQQAQLEHLDPGYHALTDTFLNMGPLGGILSALRFDREKAWLVIACDLPLLDKKTLDFLVENRFPEKISTAYESPFDGFPEPLIAIWEPKSYPVLLNFLGKGITCPRKVLINTDTHILKSAAPDTLLNVNTPADAAIASEILKRRNSMQDIPKAEVNE